MDYTIVWSPQALDDIDAIAEFHTKSDALYAQTVVEELIIRSRSLNQLPFRGRAVPELEGLEYREIFAYSYRLIYRVEKQQVDIVAVITGKIPMEIKRFE